MTGLPKPLAAGWHVVIQGVLALLFALPLYILFAQLARRGIHSFGVAPPWDWPAFLAIVAGLLCAWGYLADHVYAGHHTVLTPEGIRQRALFRGVRYLTWGDVRQVSVRSGILVLKGARGADHHERARLPGSASCRRVRARSTASGQTTLG